MKKWIFFSCGSQVCTTFFKGTTRGMHTIRLYKSFSKGKRGKMEKKDGQFKPYCPWDAKETRPFAWSIIFLSTTYSFDSWDLLDSWLYICMLSLILKIKMHVASQQMQELFSSDNCLMTISLSVSNFIPNFSEFDWLSGYLLNGLHDYDYINP